MRRPQFSLMTMLWWVTLVAAALAYLKWAFSIRSMTSLSRIHFNDYVCFVFLVGVAASAGIAFVRERIRKR